MVMVPLAAGWVVVPWVAVAGWEEVPWATAAGWEEVTWVVVAGWEVAQHEVKDFDLAL